MFVPFGPKCAKMNAMSFKVAIIVVLDSTDQLLVYLK